MLTQSSFLSLSQAIAPLPPTVPDTLTLASALEISACDSTVHDSRPKVADGWRLVRSQERWVGLVSPQQAVLAIAEGQSLTTTLVAAVMTPISILRLSDWETPWSVLAELWRTQATAMLVLDEADQAMGLVSPGSLRQALQPTDWLQRQSVRTAMTDGRGRVAADASLQVAAQRLVQSAADGLVVTAAEAESGESPAAAAIVGWLTAADIVAAQALAACGYQPTVQAVMRSPLPPISPDTTLWEAHSAMQRQQVEELAVVTPTGNWLGLVTAKSLLRGLCPTDCWQALQALQAPLRSRPSQPVAPSPEPHTEPRADISPSALLQELTSFRQALDEAAIVAITDSTGRLTYVNQRFCDISGYSPAELLDCPHGLMNAASQSSPDPRSLQSTLEAGKIWRGEMQKRTRSGIPYWLDTTIVPLSTPHQTAPQFLVISHDITDRKQAEQALQKSEHRLQQTLNLAPFPMMVHASDGEVLYLNQAWIRATGFTRQDLPTLGDWAQHLYPHKPAAFLALFQRFYALQDAVEEVELTITPRQGQRQSWVCRSTPIGWARRDNRRIVLTIASDITELRSTQKALQESEAQLMRVLNSLQDAVWSVALPSLTYRYLNPAAELVYGCSASMLMADVSLKWAMVHPDDREQIQSLWQQAGRGAIDAWETEYRISQADGKMRWLYERAKLVYDASGHPLCVDGITTDITDRKQAEVQMKSALEREKELNELRARFIAMTSHEFRTPLAVIASSAGLLETFGEKMGPSGRQEHLQRIQTYVNHTTRLLDDILLINRAEAGTIVFCPQPTDIMSFCEQIVADIQASTTQHRVILTSGSDGIDLSPRSQIRVPIDRKLVHQILINLLSNAIKYSPQGAPVELSVRLTPAAISLQVRDRGIGIPPEDQANLFTAFYRANNVGTIPGTGLGLAIVQHYVALHQGNIRFESICNQGTTFIVDLPLGESDPPLLRESSSQSKGALS